MSDSTMIVFVVIGSILFIVCALYFAVWSKRRKYKNITDNLVNAGAITLVGFMITSFSVLSMFLPVEESTKDPSTVVIINGLPMTASFGILLFLLVGVVLAYIGVKNLVYTIKRKSKGEKSYEDKLRK